MVGPRRVSGARLLALALALSVAAAVPAAASSALAPGSGAGPTKGAAAQNPVTGEGKALRYQGGRVLLDPRVLIVFWGSEWGAPDAEGMPTNDPLGVAPVVVDFFSRLGGKGDTWSPILSQYCSGTKLGERSCGPGSRKIPRLNRSPLRGWLVDTSPGPGQSNVDDQLGARDEVVNRALTQSGGSRPDDIVVLMLPPGADQGPCNAFHSVARTKDYGGVPIIGIPYKTPVCPNSQPPVCPLGTPAACLPSTEIGITGAASHEYAETVSNPFPKDCNNTKDICGWIVKDAAAYEGGADIRAYEMADTCNGYQFVQLNGKKTNVAKLWSNTANNGLGGCVSRYISAKQQG